jgi:hypothetical protein
MHHQREINKLSATEKRPMPQGYYTVEQWKPPKRGAPPAGVAILTLPFGETLTAAEQAVQHLGKAGFYRVVQTQRVIWAERAEGKLRLRKSHASSPENLVRLRQMFERCSGRCPVEEVREARRESRLRRNH